MVQTRFLVGGVIGILLIAFGAYAFIAPQMGDRENEGENVSYENIEETETIVEETIAIENTEEKAGEKNTPDIAPETPVIKTETPTTPVTKPVTATTPPPVVIEEPKKTTYTMGDVAMHASKESCWSVVNGNVYDITSYVPRHPGGERAIMQICGKDGTSLFEGQHGGDSKPESKLQSLYLGSLTQ